MKSTASLKRRRSSKQRLHCQSIENYKTKTTDKKEFVMNSRSNLKTNFERETKKAARSNAPKLNRKVKEQ